MSEITGRIWLKQEANRLGCSQDVLLKRLLSQSSNLTKVEELERKLAQNQSVANDKEVKMQRIHQELINEQAHSLELTKRIEQLQQQLKFTQQTVTSRSEALYKFVQWAKCSEQDQQQNITQEQPNKRQKSETNQNEDLGGLPSDCSEFAYHGQWQEAHYTQPHSNEVIIVLAAITKPQQFLVVKDKYHLVRFPDSKQPNSQQPTSYSKYIFIFLKERPLTLIYDSPISLSSQKDAVSLSSVAVNVFSQFFTQPRVITQLVSLIKAFVPEYGWYIDAGSGLNQVISKLQHSYTLAYDLFSGDRVIQMDWLKVKKLPLPCVVGSNFPWGEARTNWKTARQFLEHAMNLSASFIFAILPTTLVWEIPVQFIGYYAVILKQELPDNCFYQPGSQHKFDFASILLVLEKVKQH